MRYKVGVVKKITFLFMTIGLAVALIACEGAVGKTGEPGPAGPAGPSGEPPEPVNLAPIARTPTFDAVTLREGGDAADPINVAANFVDPEGQALTLSHAVDPSEGVVTANLTDGVLTVAPVAAGTAVITVTASDGNKSASATLNVTVEDAGVPIYTGALMGTALTFGGQHTITRAELDASFEGESLRYSAETAETTIVLVTQADDDSITITALNEVGKATVTITATDEDGETVPHSIEISVVASLAPQAGDPIPNPDPLTAGGEAATVNAFDYFSDPAGGDLDYTATSSNTNVATVNEVDGVVTIMPLSAGTTMVEVTAENSHGEVSQMFTVTVEAAPVEPPAKPTTIERFAHVYFEHNGGPQTITLSDHFSGATDYKLSNSDSAVVSAALNDDKTVLTLTRVGPGTAAVRITPSNISGDGTTEVINVTVKAAPAQPKPPELKMGQTIPAAVKVTELTDARLADSTATPDLTADSITGDALAFLDAGEKVYMLRDLIKDPERADADLEFSTTTSNSEIVAVYADPC